jgi:predicted alpha/beta-hydrolase family hydrolase
VVTERLSKIEVPGAGDLSIASLEPQGEPSWQFIYAPGAGSNIHDPFGVFATRQLVEHGVTCTRFQFPYQEARRESPDRPSVLEAAWRAVIDSVRSSNSRLVIGGRSMGGRIASQVVAAGADAQALALFAYPLHPPGKPEQRRDSHLHSIAIPVFFCSGTRDPFATPQELTDAAGLVNGASLHLLEGADHGFGVPKASGRTREDVRSEAVKAMWRWLQRI